MHPSMDSTKTSNYSTYASIYSTHASNYSAYLCIKLEHTYASTYSNYNVEIAQRNCKQVLVQVLWGEVMSLNVDIVYNLDG